MTITARSENRSIVDLEQVLIHFISENDNSASPLVIVWGQVTTKRRQMFGKAPSSSANKRLFRTYLSVVCQSVFHLRTSFPRDFRNGMSFSQYRAPFTLSDPAAVPLFTIIDGTRQSRWWAWRSSSENRSCIWMIKESIQEEEQQQSSCNGRLDWNLDYNL